MPRPYRKTPSTWTPERRAAQADRCRIVGRRSQPAVASAGGKAAGIIAVTSGHLDRIRTFEITSAGGKKGGASHVRSGHIHKIRTPESTSLGGRVSVHLRHHVTKGILKPGCVFCLGEPLPSEKKSKRNVDSRETAALE